MTRSRSLLVRFVVATFIAAHAAPAADLGERAAAPPPPPPDALGYPSRAPDLDVLPGFRDPPPGYGQVPFWWWSGDTLDRDRLLWQIEQLHAAGIAGVQVNYAHEDTPGWPTYPSDPPIFSDAWWDIWKFVAGECARRDMGIGLSGYTLDWPNGRSLVSRTVYAAPGLVGRELRVARRDRVAPGANASIDLPPHVVAVRAYALTEGRPDPAVASLPLPLPIPPALQHLDWTAPPGPERELWVFVAEPKPGSLDPMHPRSGQAVIDGFFQRFQDHAPNRSAKGLNFFFHDELQFGVGDAIWTDDLPERFRERKGYDLFDALPGLLGNAGPRGIKGRLDFLDLRMQLVQERYFAPIHAWHASRGLIYGCDQGSRGRDPMEFGDYFSAVRWYTAPGHDTPGGHADLIKGKVSSSIAQLYRRPRVWLEGYHSLGWGATPARLMEATCENYLYGCNLLNLHGLYYSTHGSSWEWAPPCYHFRMPYWRHMGTFLRYFERLSYLLSQGSHQADIAVLYPVTPGQANLGGPEATRTAFALGEGLVQRGRDFVFLDDDSLLRARLVDGRLAVSEAAYRVLVLPALRAVRWASLEKIRDFRRAGGWVVAVGPLPEASDRAGAHDPAVDVIVRELFGASAAEWASGAKPGPSRHASGGFGLVTLSDTNLWPRLDDALRPLPLDVTSAAPVKALHRRVGPRDVYLVLGAPKQAEVTFRARGRVELWDPWTGDVTPIPTAWPADQGTRVRLPRGPQEAHVVVFSPNPATSAVTTTDLADITRVAQVAGRWQVTGFADAPGTRAATLRVADRTYELRGQSGSPFELALDGDWEFQLEPTLDNRWGDFRLPAFPKIIGPEARILRHAVETAPRPAWQRPDADDAAWPRVTHGFGTRLLVLGPLPADADPGEIDRQLAALDHVDPARPVELGGRRHAWRPYAFSWRLGKEGDPGHQGFHGLKSRISDDFLCLGKPTPGHNETVYRPEPGGTRYYVWTTAVAPSPTRAQAHLGGLEPAAMFLNGQRIPPDAPPLELRAGANTLLLRYESAGRGHVVLQRLHPGPARTRTPLAMRWFDEPGVVPFEIRPADALPAEWFRFLAPPGLTALTVAVHGTAEAWIDGQACSRSPAPDLPHLPSAQVIRFSTPASQPRASVVALRVRPMPGHSGAAALPEPIQLDCGPGRGPTGDWSLVGTLESYSGAAWYRRDLVLDPARLSGRVRLDLGDVVATAEVRLNGEPAGVRVAPPWTFDLSRLVRPGTNRLEVLVCNTLANHYQTIPTPYRGQPRSGLLGPVRLTIQPEVILE